MEYYAVSDIGRCRNENQDTFGSIGEGGFFFAIVCDGMGGAAAGKQAAELACATAIETVSQMLGDTHKGAAPRLLTAYESKRILREALERANQAVYSESKTEADKHGMGTTVAAVLFYYGHAYTMHVGDSRIYLMRGGALSRLTEDHSVVQMMVDTGEITEEEARIHPSRNMITRAVGVGEQVSADYGTVKLQSGDIFLLCSDGLTGMVGDSYIENVLLAPKALSVKTNALISAALDEGGEDNVTVFLAECGEDDVSSVWEALTDVRTEDITVAYAFDDEEEEIKSGREDFE